MSTRNQRKLRAAEAQLADVQQLVGALTGRAPIPAKHRSARPAAPTDPNDAAGPVVDPEKIRDIAPEVLGEDGRLRILPAAYWATTTVQERALFGQRHGIYSYPTQELVDHLRDIIDGRKAIEIGAGNGVLADALGIPGTDSRQQDKEPYRSMYALGGWATVPYGPNIVEAHASRAVRQYRPDVVIGCWVTRKFDPAQPEAGGNEVGIDELDVFTQCRTYVLVGNEKVHAISRMWTRPHTIEYPPWLYSRASNGSRDFIAVWQRQAR